MNILARIAHALLSLWIGAVAAVGILVAPNVFGVIRARMVPDPLSTAEANGLAGDVMLPIFSRVDLFGILAAGLFLAAAVTGSRLRAALAAAIGLCAAVNVFLLTPRIVARTEGFETLHRLSEGLWGAILLVGLFLAFVGPRRPAGKTD